MRNEGPIVLCCFQLLPRKSIGATGQVAGTVQDQHCIIVADVSNAHQHAQPRVLRPGPMGLRREPSGAWGLGRQAINYARRRRDD